jgi:hypothetical protein
MANEKLLVSTETVKANSIIEGNVEPAKLRQCILEAQRIELKSILGARLFGIFLDSVDDSGSLTGLTSIQTECYEEYIVPLLSKYAEERFVYATSYQLSNIGVAQTNTSNNKSATDESIAKVAKRSRNDADFYAQRLKNFILLSENSTDLAVYYYESNQNIAPQKKVAQGFIYTGPHRGGNPDGCCNPPGR